MKKWMSILCVGCLSIATALYGNTTSQVFAKHPNMYFIETGSYKGDGIQQALDAGFSQVHSIELSEKYFQYCKDKFIGNHNVFMWFGDSAKILSKVMEQIDASATIWLDAHCMLLDTAKGETMTPILEELEVIKNHPIKTHTILIDDVRLFETWVFDSISLKTVIDKLIEINPEYVITFDEGIQENDVLVAYIPR